MISISSSDSIVLLERRKTSPLHFSLKIMNRSTAEQVLNEKQSYPSFDLYTDCDEDTFLSMTDKDIPTDSWTSIWKSGNLVLSEKELEKILEKAPEMFPFLALDENEKELMLAWGKVSSLKEALVSGHGTYYSRSRNKPWVKGEESGHLQNLNEILISLDPFYVLYKTKQIGAACHTGYYSCFFRQILSNNEIKFVYADKVGDL